MKMPYILFIIATFYSCTKQTLQNINKKDIEKMHLAGKIKSISQKSFTIDENGNSQITPASNAEQIPDFEMDFNEAGYKLNTIYTDRYGIMNTESFEYDSVHKLISHTENRPNNNMKSDTNNEYDLTGKLIKSTNTSTRIINNDTLNTEQESLYIYDKDNHLLEKNTLSKDEFTHKSWKEKSRYNETRQEIERLYYSGNELVLETSFVYKNGIVVERKSHHVVLQTDEMIKYNEDGQILTKEKTSTPSWEYKYNDRGDKSSYSSTYSGQTIQFTYEYEYDEQGNWTKQSQMLNGIVKFVVERKISYWP